MIDNENHEEKLQKDIQDRQDYNQAKLEKNVNKMLEIKLRNPEALKGE